MSALVAAGVLLMLTACSGDGAAGSSGAAEMGSRSDAQGELDAFAAPQSVSGSAPERIAKAVLVDRKLVKSAVLGLESNDVDRVLHELDGLVAAHEGIAESSDIRTDDDGDAEFATVVIRVPVDRFEGAVEDIANLAELVREQTSSEDVTTRVADVGARVESAERSIAQLQRLFSRATDVGDVIALESELSQRQAQLESLQARQRSLGRQTSFSTIHVSVARRDPGRHPGEDDPAGFLDGLASGWSGLVAFVRGVAHVLGLVLPFGALATLIGLPTWLLLRRRHQQA